MGSNSPRITRRTTFCPILYHLCRGRNTCNIILFAHVNSIYTSSIILLSQGHTNLASYVSSNISVCGTYLFFVEDPVEHTDPKQLIEQGSNGHVNPNSLSNALAIQPRTTVGRMLRPRHQHGVHPPRPGPLCASCSCQLRASTARFLCSNCVFKERQKRQI